ncbi:hypothetical protein MHYP_G00241020 [Metynnis hypsauchen]
MWRITSTATAGRLESLCSPSHIENLCGNTTSSTCTWTAEETTSSNRSPRRRWSSAREEEIRTRTRVNSSARRSGRDGFRMDHHKYQYSSFSTARKVLFECFVPKCCVRPLFCVL